MKHIVIVSNTVSARVPLASSDRFEVILCSDPCAELRRHTDETALLLLFCSPQEFPDLLQIISTDKLKHSSALYLSAAENDDIPSAHTPLLAGIRIAPFTLKEAMTTVETAFAWLRERYECSREKESAFSRLEDMHFDQDALIRIGRSLSTEKDQNTLLRMILMLSKEITGADAGSIYIVEGTETGKQIRFKYSHTFSMDLPLEEFVLPYSKKSITGYVAITGTVLNIPDVYLLSDKDPVSFNNSFDKTNNYRSKSMLAVPMRNHLDEIIGVIQLINSKEDAAYPGNEAFGIRLETPEDFDKKVVPFDRRYEHLMEAVAGQAAIAIENNRMIIQIQHQFEAFVKASVTAIESRDPATSGHSFRVAEICTLLARAVNDCKTPPFAAIDFSDTQIKELEYAALLHDFGKVYIDLSIFMKAKKLFPRDFENLLLKLDYLYRYAERIGILEENTLIMQTASEERAIRLKEHQEALERRLDRIKEIKKKVTALNEPTVTEEDPAVTLASICSDIDQLQCSDIDGNTMPIFTQLEKTNLSILRGSLNSDERREIESHVTHTYNFVSRIPWPPEFKEIPQIALGHHEKLDGTGYPHGDKGDQISLQSRIMAIADVYDALTATDRPYKKALSHEKAISILQKEADSGKIDADLFNVFKSCDVNNILATSSGLRNGATA
jgi:HD-GYP domain-containing protein (c-di-GMP phosphodiesterase class II)